MIQKILIATDGSRHAHHAAEKALELAKCLGEVSITLLHVTPKITSRNNLIQANFDVRSLLEDEAHQAIIRTEVLFLRAGMPFYLAVALGNPVEEIVKKVEEGSFDLLVMGSRGLNKLQEFVMGSVSNEVLHKVKCPVLIVK